MATNTTQKKSRLGRSFIIIILVIVAGILLNLVIKNGFFRRTDEIPHDVTYIVTGDGGVALVTYTRANGEASEPEFVSLPWRIPSIRFYEPTMTVLTAHNSMQYGYVECKILLDGKEWIQDSAKQPQLNASCGGFVP